MAEGKNEKWLNYLAHRDTSISKKLLISSDSLCSPWLIAFSGLKVFAAAGE